MKNKDKKDEYKRLKNNLKIFRETLSDCKDETKDMISYVEKVKEKLMKDSYWEYNVSSNFVIYFLSSVSTLDLIKKDIKEVDHDLKKKTINDKTIKLLQNIVDLAKLNFDRNEDLYNNENKYWEDIKDPKFLRIREAIKKLAFFFKDLSEKSNQIQFVEELKTFFKDYKE